MDTTINYYNKNTEDFINQTASVDFTDTQNAFLQFLPKGAKILDFGCGSGRDTRFFLEQGYSVDAIDGATEICKAASDYTGIAVKQMYFHELDEVEKYDGIWACASILHVKRSELPDIIKKMCVATKTDGVIYISFKYGEFEGERNGRFFTDMTECSLAELLKEIPELKVEKQWITGDVREGRGDERWLNVILRK